MDGLFAGLTKNAIKILSIHKFQEDHGKTTVATEAFEGCNLVLVTRGTAVRAGARKASGWSAATTRQGRVLHRYFGHFQGSDRQ